MKSERDIDRIIEEVRAAFPKVDVDQLKVSNPADDDGIWYFGLEKNSGDEIQIESPYGRCPFLIETYRNDQRRQGATVEETVEIICEHLRTREYNK